MAETANAAQTSDEVTGPQHAGGAEEQALRTQIKAAMELDGISQAKLAGELGLSYARFNQWLHCVYPGKREPIVHAVRAWLDRRIAAAELKATLPDAPEYFETPSANAAIDALSFAQIAPAVVVIYGGAGVGKTTAIRRYQSKAPNVWAVTATPNTARPGPLLSRICVELGIRPSANNARMETSIYDRVRDTRGLLVVDEAQHLCHRSLDCIRQIHDATSIGLALAGNERIYAQMTGGSRDAVYAQVFSRLAKRVRLTKPKPADVDALLSAWGVNDPDCRKFCMDIGRRPGALRGLTQTLRLARMFASQQDTREIGLAHVRHAWLDLGGDA
jgi:DNA transposition AAA+ family ATPase